MESLLKQWPLDFTVLQANKVCSGALLFVLSFGGYPRYLECLWAQSLCVKVTETTQCFPFSVTSKVNPGRPWAFGKGSGHPRQWKVYATLLVFLSFCVSCVATWKEEDNSLILCVKMFPLKAARLLWKVNGKGNNFSSTIFPCLPGHKLPYFSRVQGIWARPLEISCTSHPSLLCATNSAEPLDMENELVKMIITLMAKELGGLKMERMRSWNGRLRKRNLNPLPQWNIRRQNDFEIGSGGEAEK